MVSCAFFIQGWRCYNISEQCSCSAWEKSDGQRWWCSSKKSTYQHLGTVLGKPFTSQNRDCLPAQLGEFLLVDYPYLYVLIIVWKCMQKAPRTCQSWLLLWQVKWRISKLPLSLWHIGGVLKLSAFFSVLRSKDLVIRRHKQNYQLNVIGNIICNDAADSFSCWFCSSFLFLHLSSFLLSLFLC